jgi:amidophosphoribosyltransferase
VDDSIVRGTTSSKVVRMIKDAGAKEVHMRIASPPITGSFYYGMDTPSREKLISYRMSIEETRKYIGDDSLAFSLAFSAQAEGDVGGRGTILL